jgi:type III secretion protein I
MKFLEEVRMMADVMGSVVQKTAEKAIAEKEGATLEVKEPKGRDVEKFQKALESGADSDERAQKVNLSSVEEKKEGESGTGLGDRILQGMEKLKGDQDAQVEKINKLLGSPKASEMSTQDLMKLQLELVKLTEERDVTSKVADKSSQGVQTLIKNQ